jgi:hypothetical protein
MVGFGEALPHHNNQKKECARDYLPRIVGQVVAIAPDGADGWFISISCFWEISTFTSRPQLASPCRLRYNAPRY